MITGNNNFGFHRNRRLHALTGNGHKPQAKATEQMIAITVLFILQSYVSQPAWANSCRLAAHTLDQTAKEDTNAKTSKEVTNAVSSAIAATSDSKGNMFVLRRSPRSDKDRDKLGIITRIKANGHSDPVIQHGG